MATRKKNAARTRVWKPEHRKITPFVVRGLRICRDKGITVNDAAEIFNIGTSTASAILRDVYPNMPEDVAYG